MVSLLTLNDQIINEQILKDSLVGTQINKPYNSRSLVERTKAQEISIATELPVDQIEAERAAGDNSSEVIAKNESLNFDYALAINQAYQDGLPPETIAAIIEERKEKGEDMSLSEYMLVQHLMLSDGDINPYAARTLTNMETWNRLMQEAIEENDQSGVGKVLSFFDVNILREITIGAFENVTLRSNREGETIRAAFNQMKPEEFEKWALEYIEERKDEGIFSSDSIWNLYKTANDATYLGDDPMSGVYALFGVADIATLGTSRLVTKPASALARQTGKVLGVTKSRTPVDVIATLGDEVQAASVSAKLVDDIGAQTDEIAASRSLPKELDPVVGPNARPSGVVTRNHAVKNRIVEELELANRKGSFGELVPISSVRALATKTAESIAKKTNNVALTRSVKPVSVIDEGSDDYKIVVRMGKDKTGGFFRRKMDAEAIAKNDPTLRVVKREEGRGWYLETEKRLDISDLPESMQIIQKSDFIRDSINKMFGASTVRLGDKLGAKFLQAEAGQALIGGLVKPYQKKIRAVKGKELENLSDFMTQLRDGELSHMRQAPSVVSFESMYKTMYGSAPSKATTEGYEALIDILDATWHIKSSERLKRAVAADGVFLQMTDEFGNVAYRVSQSQIDDEFILDLATLRPIRKAKLQADQIVYKVPETFMDHLYFVNPKGVRVLERVDIMPYNVGGPRTNSEFRWFLGTVKEQRLASGKSVSVGFKTLLGSFGKDQIEMAVSQLNNISRAVKKLLDENGIDDIALLSLSKAQYDELGDVIRANNTWNKHVTDLEDLQRLAQAHKFNFTEQFVAKARDEKISIGEAGGDPTRFGLSVGEDVSVKMNNLGMKRGDTPLMEFGGKSATNANPISAIADQFGTEAFGYANRAASQNALVGWNKLAETNQGLIKNWARVNALPRNDFLGRLLEAEVTKTGKFNDVAAQLRETQDVIKRRLNQPTWLSDKWESFTRSATEFVFEKTGFKWDLAATDPASRLLQVGFYSKFGFFNPDQFMLQGLHSLTIVGISPTSGVKALGMTTPMLIIANSKGAARQIAIKRLAKMSGLSEDELNTLVRYIDESGRNIIDNQVIELQAPQKFGAASTLTGKAQESVGKFLDKSTIFFREGERFSRMTGIITAFLEHRAKRPDIDPLSPSGKTWITNREQDLTFRMTSASRSFAQSGPMRVPTQWLTFSLRAMENIAVGRNFTAGERARMFLVMGPMWGLTGLGIGRTAGYVTEKLGYASDDPQAIEAHNMIKYGLFDQLLGWGLGTETAYAQRAAPLGQITDTYRKLFDESLITTLFGPSGEIAGDFKVAGVNAIRAMFGGRTEMVREDLTQLVRNLSTVDKIVKIRELIETGNYRSRTRKLVVGGLEPNAAAAVLMGATPAPVQNYYDYQEMVFKKNEKYLEIRNRLKSKAERAMALLREGDQEDFLRGSKLWEEINDELWAMPLSNELKISLQNSLVNVGQIPDVMKNAHKLDLSYSAGLLLQQMY